LDRNKRKINLSPSLKREKAGSWEDGPRCVLAKKRVSKGPYICQDKKESSWFGEGG